MSSLSAASINSQRLGDRDYTRFWVEPEYSNLECLYATFHKHQYAPHVHETYAFGVIESGVELYTNRGCEMQAVAGQAVIVNPDDLHDGRPATGGFTYRMFYPAVDLMQSLVNDITEGHSNQLPSFDHSVLEDQQLALMTSHLHRTLDSEPSRLARDNALLDTLGLLIRRHAKFRCTVAAVGQERESILRLQKYMLANLAQNIDLQKLADYLGWSRYFLIRAFRKHVGVTPYAWLLNQRVIYARSLLRGSVNLADVANCCGFFDQSHFSLVFKRMVGVSPGRYQKGCNIFQ